MAIANTTPDPSQLSYLIDAGFELIPLHGWDEVNSRGRGIGKAPIYNGWGRTKPLTLDKAADHMAEGRNIGIRLGKGIGDQLLCAYDIDKGNLPNGPDDIPGLVSAIAESLGVGVADLVIHKSGNDGLHVFFLSSQADLKGITEIDGIKVEIKSKGQQVVAPGSVHPDTHTLYRVHPDSASHHDTPIAPDCLVERLSKHTDVLRSPQIVPPSRVEWIAEQLAEAIHQDGSEILVDYGDWLKAGMAFHAASGGDYYGLLAWIRCSDAGEEMYCEYKWQTFGEGDVTEKSLNHFMAEAGVEPTEAPALTREEVLEFIADDFADLSDDEVAPVKKRNRLLSLDALFALPDPVWLVDHAIPENGLVALYGPPKSAKTFLAIDIALSMATGRDDVHGFNCQPGRVLYVLAEGGAAMMGNRAKAWIGHHSRECTDNFAILDQAVMLSSQKSVDRLLEDMDGAEWDLVVIDTLARCMDGDENSVKDMNLAIKGCDYIRRKTGAAVLLVHHSGKDQSKGLRGSTALLGAVDATLKMKPSGSNFELSVPELRHGEPPEPKLLKLHSTAGSAVLTEGKHASFDRGEMVLEIASRLDDGISATVLKGEVAQELSTSERQARKYIVNHIPDDRIAAATYGGFRIWREKDSESSSPNAELVRILTTEK